MSIAMPEEMERLKSGHPEQAIEILNRLISQDPGNAQHHTNIGVAFRLADEFLLSALHHKLATQIDPANPACWYNLAILETEIGDFDGGFVHAQHAHEIATVSQKFAPLQKATAFQYGCALLREGKVERAWPLWEMGRYNQHWVEPPGMTIWDGEQTIKGKRIVVLDEGGFGDTIMFMRWCANLQDLGAHVTLLLKDKMFNLLRSHPWIDNAIRVSDGLDPSQYDFCASLMSLPAVLRQTADAVPCAKQYIYAHPIHIAEARGRMFSTDDKRIPVGICWKSTDKDSHKVSRSISVDQLDSLQELPVRWISLVPEEGLPWMEVIKQSDWSETAGLVDQLDAVVSVDTAIAHLSGAMGKPTYTILPPGSEWRWFRKMNDSPFYPSMKLFRATEPKKFEGALHEIKTEIRAGL